MNDILTVIPVRWAFKKDHHLPRPELALDPRAWTASPVYSFAVRLPGLWGRALGLLFPGGAGGPAGV